MDQEHNAFRIQLERTDDKLALYLFFPFWPAQLAGLGRRECGCVGFLCVFINFRFGNFKNRKLIIT